MARDIEEFLRRAAERRQQQKAQGQRPQPAQTPIEEIEVEIVEPEIVKPVTRKPRKPPRQPVRSQRPTDMRQQSVGQHVDEHLNTRRISEHAENLGTRIQSVHDQVDAEVHQHLDHDINKIDDRPTITDDPRTKVAGAQTSVIADSLLTMLANPESVRQAILVSEILNRPDWDDEAE